VAGPISLGARVIAGFTDGAPPLQKRLALGGRYAHPAYERKEFPGENMLAGTIEFTWHQPSPWPAPAVFYDGGAVWGEATAASGWRSDVGFGLRWPGTGRVVVRADFSFALGHRR
jgi:hemolysin activation/secretion protein